VNSVRSIKGVGFLGQLSDINSSEVSCSMQSGSSHVSIQQNPITSANYHNRYISGQYSAGT